MVAASPDALGAQLNAAVPATGQLILHLLSSGGFYGAERMLLDHCQATPGRHRVLFLDAPQDLVMRFREAGIDCQSCHGLGALLRQVAAMRGERPLINTHNFKGMVFGWLAATLWRLPLVTTQHGFTPRSTKQRFYTWLSLQLCRTPTVATVVCVAESIARIHRQAGVPASKLQVIPNGLPEPLASVQSAPVGAGLSHDGSTAVQGTGCAGDRGTRPLPQGSLQAATPPVGAGSSHDGSTAVQGTGCAGDRGTRPLPQGSLQASTPVHCATPTAPVGAGSSRDGNTAVQSQGSRQAPWLAGYVGRLSSEKGPDLFLDTLIPLCQRHPHLHAVMLGDGPERATLQARIDAAGLAERITLPGFQRDMQAWMTRLDALVISSRTEGTPMILLEAMQDGVPVVAFGVGGIPDVIEHGRSGLLAAPLAVDELAAHLQALLDDPQQAEELVARARQTQRERYHLPTLAQRWALVYQGTAMEVVA
ncbi:glycosyltransferase family 4 protein [Pseudomonas sp. BNK-44-a]|uniref:glycosyltransferase family 4 protein n=1 Tax=Pseudomonas sp. BNK-44-a TaxID=3376178 RepID=UPI0039BF24BC